MVIVLSVPNTNSVLNARSSRDQQIFKNKKRLAHAGISLTLTRIWCHLLYTHHYKLSQEIRAHQVYVLCQDLMLLCNAAPLILYEMIMHSVRGGVNDVHDLSKSNRVTIVCTKFSMRSGS